MKKLILALATVAFIGIGDLKDAEPEQGHLHPVI